MSEPNDTSTLDQQGRIPKESTTLDDANIFDAELLDSAGYPPPPNPDSFADDPIKIFKGTVDDLKDMMMHRGPFAMPPVPELEHKVRIFWLHRSLSRDEVDGIEVKIEALLNDGYCCHMPTVCSDFLVMDFSRRKDDDEATATRATNQ